jgi:hypothetical protein
MQYQQYTILLSDGATPAGMTATRMAGPPSARHRTPRWLIFNWRPLDSHKQRQCQWRTGGMANSSDEGDDADGDGSTKLVPPVGAAAGVGTTNPEPVAWLEPGADVVVGLEGLRATRLFT